MPKRQRVRYGMVGGGQGAFIGDVHRLAARLDDKLELVCGVFSRSSENSEITGRALGLSSDRIYPDYETMMEAEKLRPENDRMEFVSIVTPNHLHYPVAVAALKNGFHVLSDKPATKDLAEAESLRKLVRSTGQRFALTHTYLGYPLITHARNLVKNGELGTIRKVFVEYLQGWLVKDVDNKQAAWRMDPSQSGKSGCMADIGTHAHNLAEYVTGARMTHVAADLSIFGEGRVLDDDGSALFKMETGIKGVLSASQICTGLENGLNIRVYGTEGGIEWSHETPNRMTLTHYDRPTEIITAAQSYLPEEISGLYRVPAGHPEGYIEAFANIYLEFADAIRTQSSLSASIDNAVRGMAFIEALVESHSNDSQWTEITA